jgi:hypothetical protein
MFWTTGQRAGLTILAIGIALLLAWRWTARPARIPDPQPPVGDLAHLLPPGVDPNSADAATLAAIPGLGPTAAQRIVAYREKWRQSGQSGPAFQSLEDLDPVEGIGPSTLRNIEPYLVFPGGEGE